MIGWSLRIRRRRNLYTFKNLGDSGDVDAFIQHDRRDDLYSGIGPLPDLVIVVAFTFLWIEYLDQSRQNLC